MGNTNILIVSHASLCEGLVDAFHMLISSKEETISAVSLTDAGVEDFRHRLSKRVEVLLGQGSLLIMSDLFGGTPFNEANMIYQRNLDSVQLVSGANFPMLAEAGLLAMSGGGLQEVYECALESGRAGVMGTDPLASDKGPDNDDDLF